MLQLNLPSFTPRLRKEADKLQIRCLVRNKWLILTPEEWVRQHVLHLLNSDYHISYSRMAIEYPIQYGGRRKRADILVFSRNASPLLLVECKAPHVPINNAVSLQIATYNKDQCVPFLLMSNGMEHHLFRESKDAYLPAEIQELIEIKEQ